MLPISFYILLTILVILVLGILVVLLRTLLTRSTSAPVEQVELPDINGLDLAANLAEIIQCPTVSYDNSKNSDFSAFIELHEILRQNYPLVHEHLGLEKVNDYSLLYTWKGSQPEKKPVLFAAHLDVVPADDDTLEQWDYPPFSGVIADGYVWGRGTIDIKCQITTLMDAVETLLRQGYQPNRTIYLAFGHDEEIGGFHGAAAIASLLKKRRVSLAAMIDEGGGVVAGAFPGIEMPVALVGTAEKGSLTLELSVESPPGHSSAPPIHTSIGILAQGLTRLERNPMRENLAHARPFLYAIAPYTDFLMRMVFSNLWLFGGTVRRTMVLHPQTNAMLRTTTAITMIEGGIKTNILPPRASAQVNYRLAPGDSVEDVIRHTERVVLDTGIKIRQPFGEGRAASPVSPTGNPAYQILEQSIRQVFGKGPVSPFLVTGATDSRHYIPICRNVYRFSPLVVTKDEMGRVHGIGERISIENLEKMGQFFVLLIQAWGDADEF